MGLDPRPLVLAPLLLGLVWLLAGCAAFRTAVPTGAVDQEPPTGTVGQGPPVATDPVDPQVQNPPAAGDVGSGDGSPSDNGTVRADARNGELWVPGNDDPNRGRSRDPVHDAQLVDVGRVASPSNPNLKLVVLTFDDGPNAATTGRVLDILDRYGVKAMFFVTGYGMRNEDLVRRIAREGHELANHTAGHENLTKVEPERVRALIEAVNERVFELTGRRPKYFRAPFNAYDDNVRRQLDELGLKLVTWGTGSLDWKTDDPEKITRAVLDKVYPGSIVLFHDTKEATVQALPGVIEGLIEQGYAFTVLH